MKLKRSLHACSTAKASEIKAIPCMLWPLKVGPHPTGSYKKQQPIQMGTDFTTCWSILEIQITTLSLRKLRALIIKNYYDWIPFVNKTTDTFLCCVKWKTLRILVWWLIGKLVISKYWIKNVVRLMDWHHQGSIGWFTRNK